MFDLRAVLSKIRYGGAMAECGGGFTADHYHMTVANLIFRGGLWQPLSASRNSRTDRKRRKSAAACAVSAEARHARWP